MNNYKKKSSIWLRVLVSMTVFVIIIAVCGVIAILSVMYFNNQLHEIAALNEESAAAAIEQIQKQVYMQYIFFALLVVASVVFTIYCIYSITVRIKRPLNVLEKMAYHLTSTGNLRMPEKMAAELKQYANTGDEISSVIVSFNVMIETLLQKVEVLEAVARGDLRHRVTPSSEEDYLGIAVNEVVTNLNSIVRDVITATEQLAVGANELSIGAQSLSLSSSEQSATMDQLHMTAGEIAAEAVENAERAAEASKLTADIRVNASEGGRKMMDMTMAMNEINNASHAIRSVMKAIDEIAFQTNILALNAAVEAARAGSHGKGFAVVADEVRNLANKSGTAANDSNALIADTISKSDMGTKIVGEAIAFFKTIEEGIANINELLDEIAIATKSQSLAIEQVNNSLTDMANVVYHNSATSQQSAAASEQMSSQTTVLKETVNRFMLEGESQDVRKIPEKMISVEEVMPALLPEPISNPVPVLIASSEETVEGQAYSASAYEISATKFNPTTSPSEDGGRSPAELYAEALERETVNSAPAPYRQELERKDGFIDDKSKY